MFHILDFGRSLGIYVYARAAVGKTKNSQSALSVHFERWGVLRKKPHKGG